ncbi:MULTISPECIES: MFS transporter [unclassified Streptomyces]|uniref:MFS transporter n=1 Tax=unclassified Streptomyces TaxID=2593676 RepID=UPI0003768E8C|nr:MFS transporter [Streptomyces sp. HmicA12]
MSAETTQAASEVEPEWNPEAVRRHRGLFRVIERRRSPKLRRSDITVTEETAVRRAVKAAMLGNAMEWFDFGIYSYMAVTLGQVFFPSGNPTAQTLASFGAFAAAFLLRPIGGFVFGPLGDRIGRKKVLSLTMIMMALGTFGIGLVPSYAAIGIWAPVLLLLFRVVQGFSTGGEYGGAATFIAEYAPDKRRGFFGSYLEFGTLAGYVGAAGLVTVLTTLLDDGAMLSWGWRVPFLVAGPLGLIGMYMRLKLEDTPAFQELEREKERGTERPKFRFGPFFRDHWRALLLCMILVAAYDIADYGLLSYMPTYLTDELKYGSTAGLVAIVVVMVALMCLVHPLGALSDRVGRKPVLLTGMIGFVVLTLPAFLLLRAGGHVAIYAGLLLLGLCLLTFLATMSAVLPALFPTEVRYSALAISFNVAGSIFGGTTPLVMEGLTSATGNSLMPAFYIMLAAVVGAVAVLFMKETARQPLAGSPPSVSTPEEAAAMVAAQYPRGPLSQIPAVDVPDTPAGAETGTPEPAVGATAA